MRLRTPTMPRRQATASRAARIDAAAGDRADATADIGIDVTIGSTADRTEAVTRTATNKVPLPLEAALEVVRVSAPPVRGETVALDSALGRVLASDVASRVDHPSLDNSALDGYACRAADAASATPQRPVRLRVVGEVPAGRPFTGKVEAGEAVRIFTGGAVPEGADAIAAVEDSREEPDGSGLIVRLERPARTDAVRPRAQDLSAGKAYLLRGRRLDAAAVGLAAMMGHASLQVARRPRVALITTGDEVVAPGEPIQPGQVYDGNAAALRAMATAAGASLTRRPRLADDLDALRAAMDEASSADPPFDLLLTSGGVSMGKYDFVRDLLLDAGEVAFWKVAVRPGGPTLFGRYRGVPVLALPGNPVSSMVVFLLLGRAFIDTTLGRTDPIPALTRVPAVARTSFQHAGFKTNFQRAVFDPPTAAPHAATGTTVDDPATGPGPIDARTLGNPTLPRLAVRAVDNQSSGVARSMVAADALVRVPPSRDVAPGEVVEVIPLAEHLR